MSLNIIAIKNKAGKGKTTTIKTIAEILIKKFNVSIQLPSTYDIDIIIPINNQGKVTNVGVVSKGDPGTKLDTRIQDKIKNGCEVIICATRTSGETVEAVSLAAKNNNGNVIWTTTYQTSNSAIHSQLNRLKAEQIVDLLTTMKII